MTIKKTFFSYSRTDSPFVLSLAKDLRTAGVALWLDQLDIKGGRRWDAEIETALNSASHLIVVLSPESVKSNNVMDEVSFALENNKIVIPVLLNECTVPFRLKRLQRIDFINDYQTGLKLLLEVLGFGPDLEDLDSAHLNLNEKSKEEKRENQVSPYEQLSDSSQSTPFKHRKQPTSKQRLEESSFQPALNSIKRKYLILGAAIVVIALITGTLMYDGSDNQKQSTASYVDSPQTFQQTELTNEKGKIIIPANIKVGDRFQGGYLFFIDSFRRHGLIAATEDYDVKSQSQDGAVFCRELLSEITNYKEGGFADWRLPTMEELRLLFENRKILPNFNLTSEEDENGRIGLYVSSLRNLQDCDALTKGFRTGTEAEEGGRYQIWRGLNYRFIRSF